MKITNLTAGTTVGDLEQANARIAELETQLADLRDYNDRAPRLAVEIEDGRIKELEARLKEAEAELKEVETHRDGYHELLRVSQRGIIEVVEDALGRKMVSDAYTAVHRLANGYREAQARIQNITVLNDEMNGRLENLLEAYEEVVAGNQVLSQRAEKAEARAEAAEEKARELEARLAERTAQLTEVQGNWKKYEPIVGRMEKAEADAARLRAALEAVEWLWIGQQDQNHPTDLICPWCKQRQGHPWCKEIPTQGHAPDCARQAALRAEQPAESEGKNV